PFDVAESAGGESAERWSSTHVRVLVMAGAATAAAAALGRPFRIGGVVTRGAGRGRDLGFPTANIPVAEGELVPADGVYAGWLTRLDRKSTRLNSSHVKISYAVFCLKKKKRRKTVR